ncbi:hypothetical protein BC629DRAFT_1582860 [Irpex lacteus]|nr:hypothetical protein BC629DRAFT_1582860 [Irpex lacteus]
MERRGRKSCAKEEEEEADEEEVDLSTLPEMKANKLRLDMQIDAIIKPKKASRRRGKKNDEDVLDRAADEELNRDKMPATSKLRMLPQTSYAQSIIDNNLLAAVMKWLEPLPIVLPHTPQMDFIDKDVLKDSKLGRVVMFYTKSKRVTADIQRIANDLVSIWSRPIIKRSASYRDRTIETVSVSGGGQGAEKLNAILARARESDKNRVRKNAVAIPTRELGSYTVAPVSSASAMRNNRSVEFDTERRKVAAERMRKITRKATAKS